MDDPAWAWPAWKFGMKTNDLFSTLQDQYNTFSFSIQDVEAFHHDVSEISRDADTIDEFHRLMADRRQMRLHELNESLETLAVEIIANPKLIGSEQWQHALQLFRARSYDSIIRYFASYLPDHYLDRHDTRSNTAESPSLSAVDSVSTLASSVADDEEFVLHGKALTVGTCLTHVQDNDSDTDGILSADYWGIISTDSCSVPPLSSDAESDTSSTESSFKSISSTRSELEYVATNTEQCQPPDVRRHQDEKTQDRGSSKNTDPPCSSVKMLPAPVVAFEVEATTQHSMNSGDDGGLPSTQNPDDELPVFPVDQNVALHHIPSSELPCFHTQASEASFMELRPLVCTKVSRMSHRFSSFQSFSPKSGRELQLTRRERRSPEESLCKIQKGAQDLSRRCQGRRS